MVYAYKLRGAVYPARSMDPGSLMDALFVVHCRTPITLRGLAQEAIPLDALQNPISGLTWEEILSDWRQIARQYADWLLANHGRTPLRISTRDVEPNALFPWGTISHELEGTVAGPLAIIGLEPDALFRLASHTNATVWPRNRENLIIRGVFVDSYSVPTTGCQFTRVPGDTGSVLFAPKPRCSSCGSSNRSISNCASCHRGPCCGCECYSCEKCARALFGNQTCAACRDDGELLCLECCTKHAMCGGRNHNRGCGIRVPREQIGVCAGRCHANHCERCRRHCAQAPVEANEEEEDLGGAGGRHLIPTGRPDLSWHPAASFRENASRRYLGVELEIASVSPEIRDLVEMRQSWPGLCFVRDGSLGEAGFEICTPPTSGDLFVSQIRRLNAALVSASAGVDRRCGYHVHADARDLTLSDLSRLVQLWRAVETSMFLCVPESRLTGTRRASDGISYCREVRSEYAPLVYPGQNDSELRQSFARVLYGVDYLEDAPNDRYNRARYTALNLHTYFYRKTVEVRIAAGTINATKVINWATLIAAMVDQSRDEAAVRHILRPELDGWQVLMELAPTPSHRSWLVDRREKFHPKVDNPNRFDLLNPPTAPPWLSPVQTEPVVPVVPSRSRTPVDRHAQNAAAYRSIWDAEERRARELAEEMERQSRVLASLPPAPPPPPERTLTPAEAERVFRSPAAPAAPEAARPNPRSRSRRGGST